MKEKGIFMVSPSSAISSKQNSDSSSGIRICNEEITGIHEELKRMFLPKIGKLNIVKSTSSLNTAEFTDYIENIRLWAAQELGVYIPDPNEAEAQ